MNPESTHARALIAAEMRERIKSLCKKHALTAIDSLGLIFSVLIDLLSISPAHYRRVITPELIKQLRELPDVPPK